ncbi:hypothetical protein SPAB_00472 [Salmonella enterica subsp. enterica serovar Paratyphi B str. SPB7]|uniref:Uncharacterized protein n=1 Tax=Salmonella paratyphi B (strain ATCC BAA-1250 / SPB7) TaxID=1016998 RepID=A0A6C6YYR6_SALPB|nr:hypothetical protein SPAB_00472 [Salmonella enterica subsp. enterica serovar Paratyphi B str. SPB7]
MASSGLLNVDPTEKCLSQGVQPCERQHFCKRSKVSQ